MKIKLKKKQIDSIHEEEFILKNYNIINKYYFNKLDNNCIC